MSKPTPTPGPWVVVTAESHPALGPSWVIEASPEAERSIAVVYSTLANARLIAAAPELLRACKMVAEMAVSWQPLTPGDISEVRAAIAKAEEGS